MGWCWRVAGIGGLLASWGGLAGEAVRVLPLGDSITEGLDAERSYRSWLWRELVESGVAVDLVGTRSGVREGGAAGFDADHEGRWGWRADEVAGVARRVAEETLPDVVLLHVGHNDLWQGEAAAEVVGDIEEVVRALRAGAPDATILLSTLIPSTLPGLSGIAEVNALVPSVVARLSTVESPLLLVDAASGFDPQTMTADGVHPDEKGARHLAASWGEVLRSLIRSGAPMESGRRRLAPCPDRASCVSSLAAEGSRRVPPLRLAAPPAEVWVVARQVLTSWPRVRLEEEEPGYLRFSDTSRWLQFVDDLELVLDEDAGVIHVSSRSRVGYWDLGVNRRRVERLRGRLAALGMVEAG